MKRKIVMAVLSLIFIFAFTIGLTACNSGKSAYEIYVEQYVKENGTAEGVLSEKDWLASLIGADGEKGEQGDKGEQGEQGKPGEQGPGYWESNPQGLAFYPQDDGTLSVGAGQAILLSEITVPENYNNKAITGVYDFSDCKNLKKLNLPDGIKKISEGAFENCTKLNEIVIGETQLNVLVFNNIFAAVDRDITVGNGAFANTGFMSVTIEDSADNDTKVILTVKNNLPQATKLTITNALNSVTDIRFVNTVELSSSVSEEKFAIDFGTYGLFQDIDLELFQGTQKCLFIENACGVAVTADEYNFAPLNASYPVLVFSLKTHEITENGKIPTFVYLERIAQYNWEKLPAGVQCVPYTTRHHATQVSDFHGLRAGMAQYIKELYELNNDSKFHLYLVDNYCELILQMLVANRIPEENWTATFLSDGSGTAGLLSSTFGVDNPNQKYAEMKENWEEIKEFVYDSGNYNSQAISDRVKYLGSGREYQILERYPYVITREQPNVSWIVNRLRATENLLSINEKDPAFVTELLNHVEQVYTNNLLSALTEEQAETFKQLYKFNSDMFDEAEKQGKEVIIILGTSWSGESGNLYENIKVLVELYGTEKYVYYYKGHPGYPTSQYIGRQEYFNALAEEGYDIHELDNAIAAEIILFFKPDIYMSGYATSTFDSVESQDKALLLFGSKEDFNNYTYSKYFDVFVSSITDNTAFGNIALETGKQYYLIQYNNFEEYENQIENYKKHEIAIYSAETKDIKYYKVVDAESKTYREVNQDGSEIAT